MSTIITHEHPKFNEVFEMAIGMMGGDVVASNKEAFKASIASIELVDKELRLHFADNVKVEQDGGDDESEFYRIRGRDK